MSRTSRWPATTLRSCAAIATGAVAPISSATASSSRRTGVRDRHRRDRPRSDRDRRAGPPQRRNALAAAGGARGLGATISQVRDGLAAFAPDAARSPGRLNLFRLGSRVVIVDFAHNEAGIGAVLDVAEGTSPRAPPAGPPDHRDHRHRRRPPGRHAPRIGRIAAERAQRVAIKQTLKYLRGRTAESVVGELMVGVVAGGVSAADVPIYDSETEALSAELNGAAAAGANGGKAMRRASSC